MGTRLRPFDLRQRDELSPLLEKHPQKLSGYTFAMLAAWDPVFHYSWARPEPEAVIVSCLVIPDTRLHVIQPVGLLSPHLQRELASQAARLPYPMKIYGVSKDFLDANPELVARFAVEEEPIASNYIYKAEDLALLAGRKLAAKRNHIAQASREYTWTAHELSVGDVPECVTLAKHLLEESDKSLSLERDVLACEVALTHFELLKLRGTVIRVEGRIVAFSIWEPLDAVTAVVHFERAMRTHKGLYQVVNQETAKTMNAEGFQLINREEDLGDPGLRKSKLSYHPIRLETAYTLTYHGSTV